MSVKRRPKDIGSEQVYGKWCDKLAEYRKTAEKKALQHIDKLGKLLKDPNQPEFAENVVKQIGYLKAFEYPSSEEHRVLLQAVFSELTRMSEDTIPPCFERGVVKKLMETLKTLFADPNDPQTQRSVSKAAQVLDKQAACIRAWLEAGETWKYASEPELLLLNQVFNQLCQALTRRDNGFLNEVFDRNTKIDIQLMIRGLNTLRDDLPSPDFGLAFNRCIELVKASSDTTPEERDLFINWYIDHAPWLVDRLIIDSHKGCIEDIVALFDGDLAKSAISFKSTFKALLKKTHDNNGLQLFSLFVGFKNWFREFQDLATVQFIADEMIRHCHDNPELFEENESTLKGCIAVLGRLLKDMVVFLYENPDLLKGPDLVPAQSSKAGLFSSTFIYMSTCFPKPLRP